MADVKFTPGDWSEHDGVISAVTTSDAGRMTRWVASLIDCKPPVDGELEANAHLIAASPDLYEALKDCVQALSHTEAGPRIDAARAALAKAEGQS